MTCFPRFSPGCGNCPPPPDLRSLSPGSLSLPTARQPRTTERPRLVRLPTPVGHGGRGQQKILHGRGERSESPVALPTAAARLTKRNTLQGGPRRARREQNEAPASW